MDLRDNLAVRRTILANQRTLLTFFNAALALLIAGITLIKFFPGEVLFLVGLGFLFLSAAFLVFGYTNYLRHKKAIESSFKDRDLFSSKK